MLSVGPAHFTNVITTIQRTVSLPGGSIYGLPGGVVIEGLKGVNSFGSDVIDAQKEMQLGRVRTSLERIKQVERQFSGIVGRWNSQVNSVISTAKNGKQQLPLNKLNEVRAAQAKMQQLTGPACKALQDLVAGLEYVVSMEGRTEDPPTSPPSETPPSQPPQPQTPAETTPPTSAEPSAGSSANTIAAEDDAPDLDLLDRFADNYRFGVKLEVRKGGDNRARLVPKLEKDKFYFFEGISPPRVVRIRELQPDGLLVFDTKYSIEFEIKSFQLKPMVRKGIWTLEPKTRR